MIKSITKLPITAFFDAIYVKICSLYNAYNCNFNFCNFWQQVNNKGQITAVICKFYSGLTICANDLADTEELLEFFKVIGYSEILSNIPLGNNAQIFNAVLLNTDGEGELSYNIDYNVASQCYNILNQYPDEIHIGKFEDWYVDISHRIRHKSAFIINSDFASTLCLIANNTVLINGIAVNQEHLNLGFGRKILHNLTEQFKGTVFAICSNDNLDFYLKSGFCKDKNIFYYKG